MKDYNFFEIYENKKTLVFDKKSPYLIGFIVLLVCILLSAGLFIRNIILEYQIENMTNKIIQIQTSSEYIEASKLRTSLDAMVEYDKGAEVAMNKFYSNRLITTDLMNKIYKAIPNTAMMTSFSIDNTSTEMSFQVPDRKVAAELVLSMKETNLFHEVQLISVLASQSGQGYMSYISCILKEGEIE